MIDIGKPYDRDSWNCGTLVASVVGFAHTGSEWARSFTAALRERGTPIQTPEEGAVVVMTNHNNTLHVGVLRGSNVLHSDELAGTCMTPLVSIRKEMKRVRFYRWQG